MADEERTFDPTPPETNRSREQGNGVGQRELGQQGDPNRFQTATDPGRTQPFEVGDLGEGTPANVDIHNLGQSDNPEAEWGEGAEGAVYGANHTRRGDRTGAERGQGPQTRERNKQINSGGL